MIRDIVTGALAGAAATFLMSPLMDPRVTRAVARAVPGVTPLEEFPPRRVVQAAEEHATGAEPLPDNAEDAATWTAHLGFGMAMGALYGLVARPASTAGSAATGVVFGSTVWAVSYLGWLPAFGVSTGTASGHPGKLAFPFAAHVVFGAATGILFDRLR